MSAEPAFAAQVKTAVVWRSGSQIAAQLIAWGSTLAVIRILNPADYGLFAMSQVVLAFLSFLNGYGFASSLIQDREISEQKIRQAFGMLLLINAAIALLQLGIAQAAASYYRQPIIADMLQVQALIYLATPFIALPEVLLTREMDFKRPAIVNMLAAIVGAVVALACALSGFGVWTLIYAPIAAFWTRAIGLMIAARFFVWPSFRFGGASQMFNFGLVLLGSHFFWTIQTQADVFIAARSLTPTDLGFYAEALFLTTILSSKFIPPLNEVAFPAYARIQDDPARLGAAFAKAVQLIMLVACPAYFGLMVIADPLVHLLLGEKWAPIAPLITILAIAMPFLTLHVLIAPAVNAVGKPEITLRASLFGAVLMPAAFGIGVEWGVSGLAWAWVIAFPLIPAFAFWQGARHIGVSATGLFAAILPGALAAMAMAAIVYLVSLLIPTWPDWARLLVEISVGVGSYGAILWLLAPAMLRDIFALLVRRQSPVVPPESAPVPDQELAATGIESRPV